jgi:hypothetical protein
MSNNKDDTIIITDSVVGDGDVNLDLTTMAATGSSFSLTDSIDLGPSHMTYSYNNTTYSTIGVAGSSYNYNWGSVDTNPSVKLDHNGINVSETADIKIGNRSLKTFMEKMEQRLAILQPDPELLEKYEALRQAYEHYQTLEALCFGDPPKDPNVK